MSVFCFCKFVIYVTYYVSYSGKRKTCMFMSSHCDIVAGFVIPHSDMMLGVGCIKYYICDHYLYLFFYYCNYSAIIADVLNFIDKYWYYLLENKLSLLYKNHGVTIESLILVRMPLQANSI